MRNNQDIPLSTRIPSILIMILGAMIVGILAVRAIKHAIIYGIMYGGFR
jgi:hypothetical protein